MAEPFTAASVPDQSGRTVLVTGANSGLGWETADVLAGQGARVLFAYRSRERADAGRDRILARHPEADLVYLSLDLASLDSVRKAADQVANENRLDLLINNAGIAFGTERSVSEDGHELHFQVNYLSHFLLTGMLLPRLLESAPSRIVNVSSGAQQAIDFDDVMLEHNFTGGRAYAQSKLAQILHTFDLAEELDGTDVIVNALHPATLMDTPMVLNAGVTPRATIEQGANAVMQLVTSPDIGSGGYFTGLRPTRANAQAYDAEARARLKRLSEQLTGAR